MSSPSLKVDWCGQDAAEYACRNFHYSRVVPKQKLARVGVWERGRFIGCVLFGDGANNNMFKPYGVRYEEGCELVRVALKEHVAPVSRIVSVAMRLLKSQYPGLRLVISFADPEQGHVGGIYQVGNWFYLGMTEPSPEYIVKGRRMHGRAIRKTRENHRLGGTPAKNTLEWVRRVLDPRAEEVDGSSKHRYAYALDGDLRNQLRAIKKPYPKRPKQAMAGDQPEQRQGSADPDAPFSSPRWHPPADLPLGQP